MLKENFESVLDVTSESDLTSIAHPQCALFGKFSARILVGPNPSASIEAVNPQLCGVNFGNFKMPTLRELREQHPLVLRGIRALWTLSSNHLNQATHAFVPPETGRALLLAPTTHIAARDVLIKGVGPIEKYTRNNKLRFSARGFDGWLELSEAERDLVHSAILTMAGVKVAIPLGVVDHRRMQTYSKFTEWTGNYVRAFQCQTRVSNLFDLDLLTRKAAIDDAIVRMGVAGELPKSATYSQYFRRVLELSAQNVALLQAVGFTQDGLHYGQITLAGEMADFGVGNFRRPAVSGKLNSMYPWFRYERQPILMQNILYKTHAVKAEPEPVKLTADHRAILEQDTLFGAIKSISAQAAVEIKGMQPEKIFWKIYEKTYQAFNSKRFKADVLDQMQDYFEWTPKGLYKSLPAFSRDKIEISYATAINKLCEHYENQIETWDRPGPLSMHKQVLFANSVRSILPGFTPDFSDDEIGNWKAPIAEPYLNQSRTRENYIEDISWKPASSPS